MKKWLFAATVVIIGIGIWWDNGLQGWLAVQTGTRCGSTGDPYCYWSGFGSVFPWSLVALTGVFGALGLIWRHHTCQYAWWCWRRPQHQVGDTAHMICGHHHPDITPTTAKEAVTNLNGDSGKRGSDGQ